MLALGKMTMLIKRQKLSQSLWFLCQNVREFHCFQGNPEVWTSSGGVKCGHSIGFDMVLKGLKVDSHKIGFDMFSASSIWIRPHRRQKSNCSLRGLNHVCIYSHFPVAGTEGANPRWLWGR